MNIYHRGTKGILCCFFLAAFLFSCQLTKKDHNVSEIKLKEYPETRKDTTVEDVFFGTTVKDPYRWLENDTSLATAEWVKARNDVTFDYLSQIPFRENIRERLEQLWNYEKFSAPFKEGDWTYFYKNDGLQNQYVLYRQKEGGEPEVFLDPNEFSKDGTTSLAGISFTRDGSLAAYLVSEGGSDWRKVIVMNAENKEIIEDTLMNVKFSGIAWQGNEGFYYSSYDKPSEGSRLSAMTDRHKLYYHRLGTSQASDRLVFGGDETPRRYIGAYLTEDERYLVITAANTTTGNELYIRDLQQAGGDIIPVVRNMENEHTIVANQDSLLYILTNLDAPNQQLVTAVAGAHQPDNWNVLIPETENVLGVSTGGGKLFARYLKDATSLVQQYDMDGKLERTIDLPGLGSAGGFSGKEGQDTLYYTFTSYIYPPTIFSYHPDSGTSEVYRKAEVQFDPEAYVSEQVFYTSKDGTRIPMIITYKKGLEKDGSNPAMLYGYGGFNISLTPGFSVSNIILLENGGIYAVPNIRGGGEYGEDWHLAGTKMNKQNVFDDFIAAAEYLIEHKYTSSERLAIAGGSNGGLLVGACMTQRPELFKVAFPAVGVLDMLRYHEFTAGAGWAYDYGTAGDSKEMFEYLYGYSPYHNLRPGTDYPATLVTTAEHDDRVVPAHSFKFAARLQEYHSGEDPVLIRIETKAGHGAGKPTSKIIEEQADKWAFFFQNVGVDIR
ncbi:prolyl oligopeptidase [Anseongella ginsenosidimutans]|uniref:prolyl oligopeptidase n=1 Tax=Anseongella ginsenosidimutans TaxID=496056 RepID=A0A4R3KW37_9SPHI|nr:prolyl oligopeptidase family serine peptidase [Anseongella ginsenosidimutans]TCS89949.1 prolyl oligopeptidase [Anseongella ginsenosidimutans]